MRGLLSLFVIFFSINSLAEYVPNQFLVKFKSHLTLSEKNQALTDMENLGFEVKQEIELVNGLYFLEGHESLLSNLESLDRFEYIERNSIRRMALAFGDLKNEEEQVDNPALPNFEKDPKVWKVDPRADSNYGIGMHHANRVWEKGYLGNEKTIIAVIDTGIDYRHKDLQANVWQNPGEIGKDKNGKDKRTNGVDDDGNGFVDDVVGWDFYNKDSLPFDTTGHGTHVSGIAAAVGGNGYGISGSCPRCSIMSIRFLTENGGTDVDAILSIQYAVKMGAHVINNSWGGNTYNKALFDAFKAASDAGAIIVAAAGNDGKDFDRDAYSMYPAKYKLPGMVTVAALTGPANPIIPWWSNRGYWDVHFSAPGAAVASTMPGGRFAELYGTSMAAPAISGGLALLHSIKPGLKNTDYIELFYTKKKKRKNITTDKYSMGMTHFGGRPHLPDALIDLLK